MLGKLRGVLEGIEDFSKENTEVVVRAWLEAEGYSLGQAMNTLRLALVGAGKGPGMFDVTEFIGKAECLKRIDNLMANLTPAE
jgi:glutamyl-tRNA synthetase